MSEFGPTATWKEHGGTRKSFIARAEADRSRRPKNNKRSAPGAETPNAELTKQFTGGIAMAISILSPRPRAALYARVSKIIGQNPEMQLAELREYCQRRGWEVAGEYTDNGI